MLFEYIVAKTNKVVIGPLGYCGNCEVIHSTHKKRLYVFSTTFDKYIYLRVCSAAVSPRWSDHPVPINRMTQKMVM